MGGGRGRVEETVTYIGFGIPNIVAFLWWGSRLSLPRYSHRIYILSFN